MQMFMLGWKDAGGNTAFMKSGRKSATNTKAMAANTRFVRGLNVVFIVPKSKSFRLNRNKKMTDCYHARTV
jgi:hypothetical protein